MPACEYTFECHQGTRSVILVEGNYATYRLLYDPCSLMNVKVLATVEWAD